MHPSEREERREIRAQAFKKKTLQLSFICFKVPQSRHLKRGDFCSAPENQIKYMAVECGRLLQTISNFPVGGGTERHPKHLKKKANHRFVEPWTPATVCYDRISNVDFREENLKSNIKISISSKQQLHSLICCVFHALVK